MKMKLKERVAFILNIFKKTGFFLWKSFRSNMHLKLIALLFAFIMWSYVIAAENPQRQMNLKNISISYTGVSELTEKNLTIDNENLIQMVDTSIMAGQNYHKNITENTVKATVDLSSINGKGKYELPVYVTVSVPGASVRAVSPAKITVTVDDLVQRTVPVRCVLMGQAAEGYYVTQPVLDQDYVVISGARQKIESIVEAVVTIPVDGMKESVRASYMADLLDAYGTVVSANFINGTVPSVVASFDVLPIKTVKIDTAQALAAVSDVKEGYQAVNVSLSPEEVRIVGKEDVLSAIDSLQIKPLSAGNADASVLLEGELESIVGVEFIDGAKVDVYVQINEKQTSKVFSDIAISAKNLGSGLKATLSSSRTDVTVMGPLSAMAGVKRAGVTAYVDLSGLSAGTYVLPVKTAEIPGIASSGVSVKDATITVKIK